MDDIFIYGFVVGLILSYIIISRSPVGTFKEEIKGFIKFINDLKDDFIDLIYWIIKRKEIQKQIELDDKQYNNVLVQLRKANRKVIELETEINIILSERS